MTVVSDSNDELRKQFEVEKNELETDIEKLKTQINEQDDEISRLKNQIVELEERQPERIVETVVQKETATAETFEPSEVTVTFFC